jgi:hypothetical protein
MYTEQIQNKLEILKTEEKQLNDDLAVFEIQFTHSIEIEKLQEVRNNINILIYLIDQLPTLNVYFY